MAMTESDALGKRTIMPLMLNRVATEATPIAAP
jgi:hypothetical protein